MENNRGPEKGNVESEDNFRGVNVLDSTTSSEDFLGESGQLGKCKANGNERRNTSPIWKYFMRSSSDIIIIIINQEHNTNKYLIDHN